VDEPYRSSRGTHNYPSVKDPEFGGKKRLRPPHAAVSPFPGSYALGRLVAPPTRLLGALVARLDASWPFQRRFRGHAPERVPSVSCRGGQRLKGRWMAGWEATGLRGH
jgi:hypothetical protein